MKELLKKILKAYTGLFIISIKPLELMTGRNVPAYAYQYFGKLIKGYIENDGIKFAATALYPMGRGLSLYTKEPDMINWIDDQFKQHDVFYDIGANIGVFSLYAAIKKGVSVVAFEPESSNYYYLNTNIYLNRLQDKIRAFCVALNDEEIVSSLNLGMFEAGGALHTFKEELNSDQKKFTPVFKQASVGMSLDYFVKKFNMPLPNHLKLDVDGNEYKIIKGMDGILKSDSVKTIAVEITHGLDVTMDIVDRLKTYGFENIQDSRYENKAYAEFGMANFFFSRT